MASIITTLSDFETNFLVFDGMLANADNVNAAPMQLKLEIMEVLSNLSNLGNSGQVLNASDAIDVNGKVITIKKGNGTFETISLDLFDTKISRIQSIDNRIATFSGTNGDLKLTPATIDSNGNLIVTGNITSNTGNLFGNSDSATKLKTARLLGGVSFDGSADINLPGVNTQGNQNTTGNAATATSAQGTSFWTNGASSENQIGVLLTGYNPVYLYSNTTSWGVYSASGGSAFQYNRSANSFNFNGNSNTATTTTGNAGTATKLQTARTITLAGVISGVGTFDGTANISISAVHTQSPTITLTGAVTGSATMTNLGSVAIATAVSGTSHTHDDRYYTETESDARFINNTGDVMFGSLTPGTSGSYDLGSSTNYWRTIYGNSTSANYADLAEKYLTDKIYEVGTVLEVGGEFEATLYNNGPLCGVISELPGLRLNEQSTGQFIALKGKIPVKCISNVKKGQYCLAEKGGVVIGVDYFDANYTLKVVGVALENSKDGMVMVKV